MQLNLYSEMLSQLQNLILREPIFSYGFQWSLFRFIFLDDTFIEKYLGSLFACMHKDVLVNT